MFIYKITNKVNGKVYIGQTVRPVAKRFQRHINDAINTKLNTHFARAIRKHGPENFLVETIDYGISQNDLTKKEQYWIRYYKSTDPKFGYNETDAISKCGGNTYKSKSDVEIACIAEKIRNSKYGSRNPNAKAIKCKNINTNEELFFDTAEECKQFFSEKTHRFITTRVTHRIKGLYKNQWAIAYKCDEYGEYLPARHLSGIGISATNVGSGARQVFDSVRLASRETGVSRSTIMSRIRKGQNNFVLKNYSFTVHED